MKLDVNTAVTSLDEMKLTVKEFLKYQSAIESKIALKTDLSKFKELEKIIE